MTEKIDQLSGIAASFLETLKEDPLKAAGLIALGYVGLHLTIALVKTLWRLRWIIAASLVIVGVAYAVKRGGGESLLIDPDEPTGSTESEAVSLNDATQEEG